MNHVEQPMNNHIIISVMSKDRPGIIAEVTGAIFELNGDLADLNQSVLCGYLTMILIATFDNHVAPDDILAKINSVESATPLDVIVKSMEEPLDTSYPGLPEKTYIVTTQGKNKRGLVHGISSFCFRRNINILDLATTRTDDRYTMILQLDLSDVDSIADVRKELQEYGKQSGLHVVMQHHQLFRVTNEIPF